MFNVCIYPDKKLTSLAKTKLFLIPMKYEGDEGVVSNIWPVDFYYKIRFKNKNKPSNVKENFFRIKFY